MLKKDMKTKVKSTNEVIEQPPFNYQLDIAQKHFNNLMQLYNNTLLLFKDSTKEECIELFNLIEKQQDTIRKLKFYTQL